MKCPNCGYKHGWDGESMDYMEGDKGGFYRLPIEMKRVRLGEEFRKDLFGCPSCNKVFMEE